MIDLGFGLESVVQVVAVRIPTRCIAMVRRFADHAMPQVCVNRVLRTFDERLLYRSIDWILGLKDRHAVGMGRRRCGDGQAPLPLPD